LDANSMRLSDGVEDQHTFIEEDGQDQQVRQQVPTTPSAQLGIPLVDIDWYADACSVAHGARCSLG
jgi:hypothetical protein